ncbi:MAG TPA: aldo/keto reductase [Dehalococcoidia bacterium]|nr:aldo/keto reductase [Dehalococcoidia bacterium]
MELRGPKSPIPKGRPVDPVQAETALNVALNHGINLIDTSIDYGESEGLIGRFISHRRNEFLLASKCGCNADTDAVEAGKAPRHIYTRENIINGVELSLKRLNTDYLDLLQFHGSPPPEFREEAVQALLDLKRDGKTRFIGVSDVLPTVAHFVDMRVFDAFQFPYSALDSAHESLITQLGQFGVGTLIRGGIARGEPGHGLADPTLWGNWDLANLDELLDGMNRFEFLLRYTISHPDLSTTIIGSMNPDHIRRNVTAASRGPLLESTCAEVRRRLAAVA